MRVSLSLVLSFLFHLSTVLSFGIRGAAERYVNPDLYHASNILQHVF